MLEKEITNATDQIDQVGVAFRSRPGVVVSACEPRLHREVLCIRHVHDPSLPVASSARRSTPGSVMSPRGSDGSCAGAGRQGVLVRHRRR